MKLSPSTLLELLQKLAQHMELVYPLRPLLPLAPWAGATAHRVTRVPQTHGTTPPAEPGAHSRLRSKHPRGQHTLSIVIPRHVLWGVGVALPMNRRRRAIQPVNRRRRAIQPVLRCVRLRSGASRFTMATPTVSTAESIGAGAAEEWPPPAPANLRSNARSLEFPSIRRQRGTSCGGVSYRLL